MHYPVIGSNLLEAGFRAEVFDAVQKRTALSLCLCTGVPTDVTCIRTRSGHLVALRDEAIAPFVMVRNVAVDCDGTTYERLADRVCRVARAAGEQIGEDLAFRASTRPYAWSLTITSVPSATQGQSLWQIEVFGYALRAPHQGEV